MRTLKGTFKRQKKMEFNCHILQYVGTDFNLWPQIRMCAHRLESSCGHRFHSFLSFLYPRRIHATCYISINVSLIVSMYTYEAILLLCYTIVRKESPRSATMRTIPLVLSVAPGLSHTRFIITSVHYPVKTRYWTDVGLMLGQRCRR